MEAFVNTSKVYWRESLDSYFIYEDLSDFAKG